MNRKYPNNRNDNNEIHINRIMVNEYIFSFAKVIKNDFKIVYFTSLVNIRRILHTLCPAKIKIRIKMYLNYTNAILERCRFL